MVTATTMPGEEVRQRPLKRVEYDRLVRDGAFAGERVELIRGVIVEMSPQDFRHARAIERLSHTLFKQVGDVARVRVQLPLALADSEPEPDVAVVTPDDTLVDHPSTALLVVEVASSRVGYDRLTKGALYAGAGIPEYWIVNLVASRVEVLTRPEGGSYTEMRTLKPGDVLRAASLVDVVVEVASLL
jgi:Uma2 family endonuclease